MAKSSRIRHPGGDFDRRRMGCAAQCSTADDPDRVQGHGSGPSRSIGAWSTPRRGDDGSALVRHIYGDRHGRVNQRRRVIAPRNPRLVKAGRACRAHDEGSHPAASAMTTG